MKTHWICNSLLVSAILFGVIGGAQAQTPNNANKPRFQGGFTPAKQMEADALKQKVELPNLPDFTGQQTKFKGGLTHRADRSVHYIQHFDAREDARQVIDWYQNTLAMYKWKIEQSDGKSIMAKLPTATCSVFVHDVSREKRAYKTEIEINYIQNTTR